MAVIRHEINLLETTYNSTVQAATATNSMRIVTFDPSHYQGSCKFYFECVAQVSTTSSVRLTDDSNTVVYASISISETSYVRKRVEFTPNNSFYLYEINYSGGTGVSIKSARIIIIQTLDDNEIYYSSSQFSIGTYASAIANVVGSPFVGEKYWYYDSSYYSGAQAFMVYAHWHIQNNMYTYTFTLQEDDGNFGSWTDVATIYNSSPASAASMSNYTTFTPTSGRNYRFSAYGSNSMGEFSIYTVKIIAIQRPSFQYAIGESIGIRTSVSLSNDAKYLANSLMSSPYIETYKRTNDTFGYLTAPSNLPSGVSTCCRFSHDRESAYLAVSHNTTPFITIYKRSNDTFTRLSNPTNLPSGDANACAFSRDSGATYLAIAHNTSPFLSIYKRSGDTFNILPNPSNLPSGRATYCDFSYDSQYLAVTHETAPHITIYERSGDTFSKLPNPINLPVASGRQCAFSFNNEYLGVVDGTITTLYRNKNKFSIGSYYNSGYTPNAIKFYKSAMFIGNTSDVGIQEHYWSSRTGTYNQFSRIFYDDSSSYPANPINSIDISNNGRYLISNTPALAAAFSAALFLCPSGKWLSNKTEDSYALSVINNSTSTGFLNYKTLFDLAEISGSNVELRVEKHTLFVAVGGVQINRVNDFSYLKNSFTSGSALRYLNTNVMEISLTSGEIDANFVSPATNITHTKIVNKQITPKRRII